MRPRLSIKRMLAGAAFAALAHCLPTVALAEAPRRVVSMNLCTDQLAMMIAGPGQLHSVSYLAADPGGSVLAEQARDHVPNHGLAEEIFLMKPDLVVAGVYTTRATVTLLRTLGFRVEEFAPEATFDDVRANLTRMGALLGREGRAAELVAELDAGLDAAARRAVPARRVALYFANSYTSGSGSLVDAVVQAAGLDNIAGDIGVVGTARLPLETLILQQPDLIVSGDRQYDRPAPAQQNFIHPAFRAIADERRMVDLPSRLTVCGGPFNLDAIRILQDAAEVAP